MGIPSHQFHQLTQRLRGQSPRQQQEFDSPHSGSRFASVRIVLGIDPSLRATGFGIIERKDRQQVSALTYGVVRCPADWERTRCLATIAQEIRNLVQQFSPDACVVEGLFYAQNHRTALILGEARGASLAVIAEKRIPIYQLAPRRVKQAIVGYGGATKEAVARMVQRLLELPEPPANDASDALALALAFLQEIQGIGPHFPEQI